MVSKTPQFDATGAVAPELCAPCPTEWCQGSVVDGAASSIAALSIT